MHKVICRDIWQNVNNKLDLYKSIFGILTNFLVNVVDINTYILFQ